MKARCYIHIWWCLFHIEVVNYHLYKEANWCSKLLGVHAENVHSFKLIGYAKKKRDINFKDWYQIKHSKGWVTVLVQTNNPIYDNKQQNYNGVDHVGDELHNLRKKERSFQLYCLNLKRIICLSLYLKFFLCR